MEHVENNNILFITAYPPSDVGAAVKNTKYMLRELSQNFCVDLFYFRDKEDVDYLSDNERIRVIRVVQNSTLYRLKNALSHPYFHPLFTVRYDKRLKDWLQSRIDENKYSAIIFDHSQTFMYAQKLRFDGIKILLSHDIEAQRVSRSSNKMMYKLCLKTEKYFLSTKNAKLFALSQKDVELIKSLYGFDANVSLIYVDERLSDLKPQKLNNEYAMLGTWDRPDNYEGALWLINGLSQYLSNPITINIIGSKFPVDRVVKTEKVNLNILGFVDDPYPLISECKAMLCPLFSGAGIKVKVIDSLACGTPVIGTDIAFEGFSDKYNSFMKQCGSLSSFANEMESIAFSLVDRIRFKRMFIDDYKTLTIPNWLKKELYEQPQS